MYTREEAARVAKAWIDAEEYENARVLEQPPPRPVWTIAFSREAGSGGTLVAREVGRRLNWPVYDNELLTQLADELKVDVQHLESIDERPGSRLVELVEAFAAASSVTEANYFRKLLKLLLALGERGECIIVGRGAMIALPVETTLRIRVVASRDDRIEAVRHERAIDTDEATRYVDSTDRERSRFIKNHFRKDLDDPMLYDLILNASRFSVDECAGAVVDALLRLQARETPSKRVFK